MFPLLMVNSKGWFFFRPVITTRWSQRCKPSSRTTLATSSTSSLHTPSTGDHLKLFWRYDNSTNDALTVIPKLYNFNFLATFRLHDWGSSCLHLTPSHHFKQPLGQQGCPIGMICNSSNVAGEYSSFGSCRFVIELRYLLVNQRWWLKW